MCVLCASRLQPMDHGLRIPVRRLLGFWKGEGSTQENEKKTWIKVVLTYYLVRLIDRLLTILVWTLEALTDKKRLRCVLYVLDYRLHGDWMWLSENTTERGNSFHTNNSEEITSRKYTKKRLEW